MLDLVGDTRPAPRGVDLVEQRARRIPQPRAARLFGLQVVAIEAGPALQRIVMPAAAGEIFVAVEVAVRQDVEPGALFVADHDRERVLELLAEADVHHAGVERLRPHADVEPARPRPRARDGAGQNQILRNGEGHASLPSRSLDLSQGVRITCAESPRRRYHVRREDCASSPAADAPGREWEF